MEAEMYDEPQNKAEYLPADPDIGKAERAGIDLIKTQLNILKKRTEELLRKPLN